jgi:hypothetical protein
MPHSGTNGNPQYQEYKIAPTHRRSQQTGIIVFFV